MKLIFCLQINRGFFKLIPSFKVFVARLAQITQNNKFAISLQHIQKKKWVMNLDFFNADTILIDIMILYGDGQAFWKFPK